MARELVRELAPAQVQERVREWAQEQAMAWEMAWAWVWALVRRPSYPAFPAVGAALPRIHLSSTHIMKKLTEDSN